MKTRNSEHWKSLLSVLAVWGSRMVTGLVRVKKNLFVLSVKPMTKAVPSSIQQKYQLL